MFLSSDTDNMAAHLHITTLIPISGKRFKKYFPFVFTVNYNYHAGGVPLLPAFFIIWINNYINDDIVRNMIVC